jgi:hypothetical protein
MRMLPLWCAVRRLLIGVASGAAMGLLLQYVIARPTARNDGALMLAFVGITAILGAVGAGFLSATLWTIFGGGIAGPVATRLFGALVTLHLRGL